MLHHSNKLTLFIYFVSLQISVLYQYPIISYRITMGVGGSKKLKVVHSSPQVNMATYRTPESSMPHATTQPKMFKEQWLNHNKKQTNHEQSHRISHQIKALHTGTFRKYKLNYPELTDDLETIFDSMQVLRNTVDRLDKLDPYDKLYNMFTYSLRNGPSEGTRDENECATLRDFIVEIEGAGVFHNVAQNCFSDYYNEMDNELTTSGQSELFPCFDSLELVLIMLLNFTDKLDSFCLESAKAGIVTMCLENITRIDQETDDWQDEDEESETIRILQICTGILHNISRRLRDRQWFANSDETMLYFAKVKVERVAASALLCLAYLVNEETNHLISADQDLLRLIITMLDEAWQSEDRRCNGFSTKELAE